MLQSLSIRDFIIVDALDLEFLTGFTTLTGETGAGKSILIDALSLALGARGDGVVTRAGCEKADISATFDNTEFARKWLESNEIAADDSLLLRRVLYADGRSRAFINGVSVTVGQLKELGDLLVDIYSQNMHHSLLKTATQRQILDEFAGLDAQVQQVASYYKAWVELDRQRKAYEQNATAYADELAELRDKNRELAHRLRRDPRRGLRHAARGRCRREHLRLRGLPHATLRELLQPGLLRAPASSRVELRRRRAGRERGAAGRGRSGMRVQHLRRHHDLDRMGRPDPPCAPVRRGLGARDGRRGERARLGALAGHLGRCRGGRVRPPRRLRERRVPRQLRKGGASGLVSGAGWRRGPDDARVHRTHRGAP